MKQTKTKLLCLLLAAAMLLSLTACGKGKAADPDLIKLGDYELRYKGACIMEDSEGNDAIVLTLDFTNNGKENASYLWSVNETVMQNGTELEVATVVADYESYETVINSQFTDIAPGTTLEVQTAYVLRDPTAAVEATFEQIFGKKSGKITVDPSTLSRVETTETGMTDDGGLTATTGDALLDWWNGAWYGWWKMTGCSGSYESMEGQWWDVCGEIATGNITYEDTLAVFPYGNMMCLIEITGQQLKDALEMASKNAPEESGGFLQVSGVTYTIDTSIPTSVKLDEKGNFLGVSEAYRVTDVMVNGEPLDLNRTYTVSSHNYMLKSAGDGMTMFAGAKILKDEVMVDVDALSDYINTYLGGNVGAEYANPLGQGRITIK